MTSGHPPTQNGSTDSRLSVLENDVGNLRDDIGDLSSRVSGDINRLGQQFQNLADSIGGRDKKDWAAFWGAALVVVTVISSLAYAFYSPLNQRIGNNEDRLTRTQDKLDAAAVANASTAAMVERLAAVHAAKLTEIETQFAWECNLRNSRERELGTWINMLWADAHDGRPLPYLNLPEVGPGNGGKNAEANGFHEAK